MTRRHVGALGVVAVLVVGCAQPVEGWLAGTDTVFALPDAGSAAAPEPTTPVGPSARRAARVSLDEVAEPRGLAWDGDAFWLTDRADDRLVRLDASGRVLTAWTLPERGARALAWHGGSLYVGFASVVYRFTGDAFEPAADVEALEGMVGTEAGLVTLESGGVVVRDATLAPRLELGYAGPRGPLVRYGDDFLIYSQSAALDGETFAVEVAIADASSPATAAVRGAARWPVSAARVLGATLDGDTLWLLGGAYGSDAGTLVGLSLTPEGDR